MKIPSYIFSILLIWLCIQPVVAQPPSLVNFRGQLLDNSNQPVTDTVSVGLKVFASETGGTTLYTEEIGYVEVRNGQYVFQFGSAGTPDFAGVIQANSETWVEVSINNIPLSRQRFVSVPYALNAGSAQIASGAVTREMLSQEVLNDLNRTQISNGSITREMLDADLNQTISLSFSNGSFDIRNPFGWNGEPIIGGYEDYVVPSGKVLIMWNIDNNVSGWSPHGFEAFPGDLNGTRFRNPLNGPSFLPAGTKILEGNSSKLWQGFVVNDRQGFTALISRGSYTVPQGKTLSITSVGFNYSNVFSVVDGNFSVGSYPAVFPAGQTIECNASQGWSGYLFDSEVFGSANFGSNTSASNSVTPSMLSDSILKYLMPEIVEQPTFTGTIRNGTRVELNPGVEGKYISYQWYKDGEPIDGATSQLFTIESFDVGYHDGNYTVVASNDFGEIESAVIELAGNSNDFRGVDISSMNFQGQDLSEALFDSTTIFSNGTSGASFSGTGVKLDNLNGPIDLRGVNLHGADLRGSDLSQAQFNEQTFITAANLSGTGAVFPAGSFDLTGSNVAGVNFSESNDLTISSDTILTERDETLGRYKGANIAYNNISWGGVPNDLRGVNIAGVDLGNQDLSNVLFDSSTIFSSDSLGFSSGASLSSVGNNGPNLTNLSGIIDLRGVNLFGSNLSDSDLSRVKLNDLTRIEDANLTNVNLSGLDLSGAFGGTETPSWASSNSYFNTYYDAETVFPDDFDPAQEPGLVFVSDSFTVGGGQLSASYFTIDNDQGIVDFTSYKLRPGNTYSFRSWEISDEHSFMIGESYGDMDSSMVYRGPLTRGNEGSFMFLTIPEGFDGSLFYFCPDHSSMVQEFTLSPANHITDLNASVNLEMIWVEPGTFTMGSPETEASRRPDETQHEVTLTKGFYLGKYEVTQAQYEAVMTGNTAGLNPVPGRWSNFPNRPVQMVSYHDIQVFLSELNRQQLTSLPIGWEYALPTESQWEYACRAGTKTAYSWGNEINSTKANYNWSGSSAAGDDYQHPLDVGQYDPNPWGFHDMHGNVWEWVADWYDLYPTENPLIDPTGPSEGVPNYWGTNRVWRGGSWSTGYDYTRSARRGSQFGPSTRIDSLGFRVSLQKVPHIVELNSTVDMEMIWVEPGTFMMGSPETEEGRVNEAGKETQHEVTLTKGFYLGKYEVTQAQYEAVMTGNSDGLSATPSYFAGNPNRPVEQVSWDDSQVFIALLNSIEAENIPTGWQYALPTSAQWEFACRAGTTTAFYWGDTFSSELANSDQTLAQTTSVGSYNANSWGFFDMHGNVMEWTADWFGPYTNEAAIDPMGPTSGTFRVTRSGHWGATAPNSRSANRANFGTELRHSGYGFRVALREIE